MIEACFQTFETEETPHAAAVDLITSAGNMEELQAVSQANGYIISGSLEYLVLGGVGYMKDFGQEKRFRDANISRRFWGPVL